MSTLNIPDTGCQRNDGMTLRDWLAGHALPGVTACVAERSVQISPHKEEIAAIAYDIADAMIAERSKL